MKRRLKIFVFVLGVMAMFSPSYVVAFSTSAAAYDTIAGFSTMVSVNNAIPNSRVEISVTDPRGQSWNQNSIANSNGAATVEIHDSKTTSAGVYRVYIKGTQASTSFTVFPGEPDAVRSGVYVNKGTAAVGTEISTVQIRLVDDFLNPLANHEMNLISSRAADKITPQNSLTDQTGIARFLVGSSQAGVSTFAATDETTGTVLNSRLQIVFAGKSVFNDVGGDPETIFLAAGESVARFKIDNLAASVNVNDPISFTVTAVDSGGAVVPSYVGTVSFSSSDSNAKLPIPYIFKTSDQGTMTFNVALSFASVGSHTLSVQDKVNPLIKGQKTVQVTQSRNVAGGQVRITKPATGTYSLNTLEVAGEALPNSRVRLFDNGQQIAEVQASTTGRFTYTTSLLTDGQHSFHAENEGTQSFPVTVTIDSTPSQVEQVDVTASELAPGGSTTVAIRSDSNLNKVQITVNDVITDMEEDPENPGLYRGNITAPMQEGVYAIQVVITDKVGNVSPQVEIGRLNVDYSFASAGNSTFAVPSAVTGLRATSGFGKVTLSWTASQAQSGIAFYRVYYGTDPQDLSIVLNTTGQGTSFEITNLQNSMPYYFQVFGVDTLGNEGDYPSETVTAVAEQGIPVLCSPEPCPEVGPSDSLPEDGPGTVGMLIASILGGGILRFARKQKK